MILEDMPRGVGRERYGDALPGVAFAPLNSLSRVGFQEKSADIFFGVVNGETTRQKRSDGRGEFITLGGNPVGLRDDRHLTTIAGSRSGKGRSAIIPNLLTYGGSVLVIDPKGENASITARYRAEELGQEVCVLDPFGKTNGVPEEYLKKFNPLSILLRSGSKTRVEDAGLLADALVVPGGGEDTHWDETAKAFIEGVLLHVATSAQYDDKDLVTVGHLLHSPNAFTELLDEMLANPSLDYRIAAAARAMQEKGEREFASVLSNIRKNLHFLEYETMQTVLSGHDFDIRDLFRDRKITVYLVLPATRFNSCSQWLRLFVNLALNAAEEVPSTPKIPTLLILDEFAALGRMRELEKAIGQIAGFGVRIWTILQDMGQLKSLYGERWETFLGNSGVIQCFGTVDFFTSKWISEYLDKTSITITDTSGTTIDQKHQQGASGRNERMQTLDLMTPAEVRRYFARDDRYNRQLVFIPGKAPWVLQRVCYDQHSLFEGRFGVWRA